MSLTLTTNPDDCHHFNMKWSCFKMFNTVFTKVRGSLAQRESATQTPSTCVGTSFIRTVSWYCVVGTRLSRESGRCVQESLWILLWTRCRLRRCSFPKKDSLLFFWEKCGQCRHSTCPIICRLRLWHKEFFIASLMAMGLSTKPQWKSDTHLFFGRCGPYVFVVCPLVPALLLPFLPACFCDHSKIGTVMVSPSIHL